MFYSIAIRDKRGLSLIELLVVISIITILASIGIPQYGRFTAASRVKRAATEMLQNMRAARTMAIKENRQYLVTFNENGANNYRVGFDGNGNGSLLDAANDGYGTGPVRVINLSDYGANVIFGTAATNGPDEPQACGNCINISGSTVSFGTTAAPVTEVFNPDGSVDSLGSAFFTHNARGFTYMLRISFNSGKVDLWKWDGDNAFAPPVVTSCNTSPVRACGWTEVR